ncbi:hypothetical protein GCM10011515_25940 [Tsuneonella deserti]|uniref:Uncharacterized protein n=1 Tax=Tsuneonella deserti TaxID=2035528 RepID=A0ABQ1SAI0_9SPHN|nr:hypothetical protein [Tsuneonella deserti]GGE05196.1 hypothetical protein GCM10011515_25940 [Tsuneonella deserti]
MKKIALSLIALAGMALVSGPSIARDRLTGQERLARMLEGRVAGKPQSCVNTRVYSDSQIIDGTALVYGHGKTIWVNIPANPEDLRRHDILLVRQFGPELCRQDIVTLLDNASGIFKGSISLGDFVPYTRVK